MKKNNKGIQKLKKINTEAKKLYLKSKKRKKWTNCIKEAAKKVK